MSSILQLKITLTTLILLTVGILFAQNATDAEGKKTGYWVITGAISSEKGYAPDAIVEEGNFDKNRKTGLWKKYYPSGKLKSEIVFANGKANGDYKTYFENGQLEESGTWKLGKNTGKFEMYYPNGQLRIDKTFNENGQTEGKVVMYHPNGQKEIEFNTVNGKENGEAVWYYENGDVKKKQKFTNGESEVAQTFEMKNPPYKDPAPKKEKLGPKMEGSFNGGTGLKDCYGKTYDKNKNILMDGCFKDGRLHDGRHYIYDEFGLLDHIEVYKDGVYVGNGVIGAKDKY
jgi:antitoxin component YwqK of YwqJK toxin-antitoxin module